VTEANLTQICLGNDPISTVFFYMYFVRFYGPIPDLNIDNTVQIS